MSGNLRGVQQLIFEDEAPSGDEAEKILRWIGQGQTGKARKIYLSIPDKDEQERIRLLARKLCGIVL